MRVLYVTGVQTCALPISRPRVGAAGLDRAQQRQALERDRDQPRPLAVGGRKLERQGDEDEIGRASSRERVEGEEWGVRVHENTKFMLRGDVLRCVGRCTP